MQGTKFYQRVPTDILELYKLCRMSKKKAHLNKIKYISTGKIDITASGLGTADRVTRFSKQGVEMYKSYPPLFQENTSSERRMSSAIFQVSQTSATMGMGVSILTNC